MNKSNNNQIYELTIYLKNVKKPIGEKFINTISYKDLYESDIQKVLSDYKKENILKSEVRVMKAYRTKKKKKE